ncbi:hypothetical protein BH11MYX1_BH11MYX1_14690 [soil metagenome]
MSVQRSSTPHPAHEDHAAVPQAPAPDAVRARVDQLAPNDDHGLAVLLEAAPTARHAILEAAAQRLGNATVQRALARVGSSPTTGTAALATANTFYAAFAARNAATMRSHYAPTVAFHDPLFGSLRGDQVMLMWTTIMPAANPFQIVPSAATTPTLRSDGAWSVQVTWDAHYGLGGRSIHNTSKTTLVIKDDKIIEQRDEWDLDRWTAQALPFHLGGHYVTDLLTAAAAHSYIKVVDLIHHAHMPSL